MRHLPPAGSVTLLTRHWHPFMPAPSDFLEIAVTHHYRAAPGRVFDAWLDPAYVRQWFGPGLGETRPVTIEPAAGGRFRIVQVRDGEPVGHSGTYRTLDRPNLLAFSWAMDGDDEVSEVTVRLAPAKKGTTAVLTHRVDVAWKDYEASIQEAWTSMMAAMDGLLPSDPHNSSL